MLAFWLASLEAPAQTQGLREAPTLVGLCTLAVRSRRSEPGACADCGYLLADLANVCQPSLDLATTSSLRGADNSTLAAAAAQTTVGHSCCSTFQRFLDEVCFAEPCTAPLSWPAAACP